MNQKAADLFDQDQKQEAIQVLVQAIDQDDQDIDNYLQLGTYLTELKDYEQGEELLQKALHQFPENADLRYNLGVLYYESEHFDLALNQFNQLLKIQPEAENYLMLARIYFKQQNYPMASVYALTAHDKSPRDLAPNLLLGDCLLSLGQLTQAQTYYLVAHKLAPDNLEALFGAGIVAYILHQDDHLLLKVKQKDPTYYQQQQKRLTEIEQFLKANHKS